VVVNRSPANVREPKREQSCALIFPLYTSDQLTGDGLVVSGQEDDTPSFHSKFLSFRHCSLVFGIKMIRFTLFGMRDDTSEIGEGQSEYSCQFKYKNVWGLLLSNVSALRLSLLPFEEQDCPYYQSSNRHYKVDDEVNRPEKVFKNPRTDYPV